LFYKIVKNQNVYFTLEENERVSLTFPQAITCDGSLVMSWTGILNDKMVGFYRSKYTVPGTNEVRYNATTQCEPNDARRILPCWDEPNVRAVFEVTLIAPSNLCALSNMHSIEEVAQSSSAKKMVKFAPTPSMSTYLLCVIVGDFEYIEDHTPKGLKIRVYTAPTKKELGRFALDVAVKVLPHFEEYFGQAYPLQKLDMIAISEFSAGAMENWGLITYRETALLVDEKNTSAHTKQWVALVVAHELSHQWFGNLVSPDWWEFLWLNEVRFRHHYNNACSRVTYILFVYYSFIGLCNLGRVQGSRLLVPRVEYL